MKTTPPPADLAKPAATTLLLPAGLSLLDPPEVPGMYGPRGWSLGTPLWDLLRCFPPDRPSLNCDGALIATSHEAPGEDYVAYGGLHADAASLLLGSLPRAALADRQNLGPSVGSALEACRQARGRLLLAGYAIGPQRHDERLSVEALWLREPDLDGLEVLPVHDASCDCLRLWREARLRHALDAQGPPDVMARVRPPWGGGEEGWWLWWD